MEKTLKIYRVTYTVVSHGKSRTGSNANYKQFTGRWLAKKKLRKQRDTRNTNKRLHTNPPSHWSLTPRQASQQQGYVLAKKQGLKTVHCQQLSLTHEPVQFWCRSHYMHGQFDVTALATSVPAPPAGYFFFFFFFFFSQRCLTLGDLTGRNWDMLTWRNREAL